MMNKTRIPVAGYPDLLLPAGLICFKLLVLSH